MKEARIRVQRRFVDGNAVNSSDEEDNDIVRVGSDQKDGQKGGKSGAGTVLHFKRKFNQGAAADVRRRRAGRWGKQAGMEDEDSDEEGGDEWESSSEDEEFSAEPSEDEYFRYDHNGYLVQGQYTTEGYFMVEVRDRSFPGRCDPQAFMLDEYGVRIQDFNMGDKVKTRAYMIP